MDSLKQNISILSKNKQAIKTFIISMSLALILILVGIILLSIPKTITGGKTISDGDLVKINEGKNTFEFEAEYSGKLEIKLPYFENVKKITVIDHQGEVLVNTATAKSTYIIFLYKNQKVKIEIVLEDGANSTYVEFNYDNY